MTFEETIRAIVREEIRAALADRLPKSEPEAVVFERVAAFAKRVGISERTAWTLVARGMPTAGTGRGRRVDVARAVEWMRAQTTTVDDAIERQARANATRKLRGGVVRCGR